MKKTISIFILFIIYIFIFPLCAYSETQIRCESLTDNGESCDLRLTLFNNSENESSNTYIFCAYDSNDKPVDIKKESFKMTGMSKAVKNISFNSTNDISYAKAFALKDIDSLSLDGESSIKNDENIVKLWNFSDKKFTSIGEINEPITVDGLTLNYSNKYMECKSNGSLYLYGGGKTNDCSVSFAAEGNCRISIVASSVSTEDRILRVTNSTGSSIKEFNLNEKERLSFEYTGNSGDIYIFSKSSGVYIYSIEVDYSGIEPYTVTDIYVDRGEDIDNALSEIENNGGGTLFLQNDYFKRSAPLQLLKQDSSVTIASAAENTAVIDFSDYREGFFNTSKSVSNPGITIKGSGYSLKNIIVEKAPGCGIYLTSENCYSNIAENVISRYNNGSGFSINREAHSNTLKNCSSYRNCDLYTRGENADGFHIAIFAGKGNKLYGCKSFDNADDGYDNFANYNDVEYISCYAFNNGNADVFTGKYDFDKGYEVDKSLPVVELINSQTDLFEENLSQGKFLLPDNAYILIKTDEGEDINITVSDFSGQYWCGNGNGFKLGSGESQHGPATDAQAYRLIENCTAFNNLSKGFDRNNGNETVNVNGFLSFDNTGSNYWSNLLNVERAENIISFNSGKKNITDESFVINENLTKAEQNEIRNYIIEKENEIRNACGNNTFPQV